MKVSPHASDAKQMALRHVAQYVRPLLGEAGEKFAQQFDSDEPTKTSIMRGFVGLCFCGSQGSHIVFAQTIDQSQPERQDVKATYTYSSKIPYVAAIATNFSERQSSSQSRYQLTGSDLKHPAIWKAAKDAFGDYRSRDVTLGLFRYKINEHVVLYCALPKELLRPKLCIKTALENFCKSTKGFFLLNLLNAFFLAQATLRGDHELELLLHYFKQRMALPHDFFDRFLVAQAKALEDLHAPSTWLTSPFGSFGDPEIEPPIEPWMKAIRSAKRITVVRPLFGSLQGKPVYLVTIEPRTLSGQPNEVRYPAVVKQASLESVVKEHRGYIQVQQHFDEIRDVMPPLSVAWKLGEHDQQYVAVTPRVSGDTLRAFIRDRWESPWTMKNTRVVTIQNLLEKLLRFTETVGTAAEWSDTNLSLFYQPMLDSHLGNTPGAKRRVGKTREALAFFLDVFPEAKLLRVGKVSFLSPLWVFERRNAITWATKRLVGLKHCACRHGDFHAGNILVAENGGVTVLDFDYVDKGFRFEDEATLEVSLLLSVANAERFKESNNWAEVFPALLKALVTQRDRMTPDVGVLKNPDSFELWTLIQTIRRGVIQHHYFDVYRSLLGTALFRLIASFRGELELENSIEYHPGVFSTALLYLGLILQESIVVDTHDQNTVQSIDLFTSPLKWNDKLQLKCSHLQSVFRQLTRRVNAGETTNIALLLDSIAPRMSSPEETASVYRFGLRLSQIIRTSKLTKIDTDADAWTQNLSKLYSDKLRLTGKASKEELRKWAERYGTSKVIRFPAKRKEITDKRIFQGLRVEAVEVSMSGWQFCGLSDYGKHHISGSKSTTNKPNNDDAFAICNMGGKLMAAVADGTGDSEDGERASRCALSALLKALRQDVDLDLKSAFLAANDILQSDNRAMRLDGACCIATVLADSSGNICIANVGDTRFVSPDDSEGAFPATIDKADRRVLGGEPLGDIITSSGNIVREIESRDDVGIKRYRNVKKFALVTDGAFVSTNETDIREIRNILESSGSAKEIAEAIKRRALNAFKNGTKPDNVTVIVGLKKT